VTPLRTTRPARIGPTFTLLAATALLGRTAAAAAGQEPRSEAGGGDGGEPHAAASHAHGDEPPFEWGGVFLLPSENVTLRLQPGPDDAGMRVVLLPVGATTPDAFAAVVPHAAEVFGGEAQDMAGGGTFAADGAVHRLVLAPTPMTFTVGVTQAGPYALFTEHMPWEFQLQVTVGGDALEPLHVRQFRPQVVRLTPVVVAASGLSVGKVVRRELTAAIAAPARVSFDQEAMAHVGSPLQGWVVELKVRLGDTVDRGQPLLVIESPELGQAQSDYLQKRTAAEAAGPAVALAQNAWERADALHRQSQGLSLTEVQRRELEYRAAQANQRAAEAASAAAENRLHLLGMDQAAVDALVRSGEVSPRYVRTAPIAGTVVEREVTLGELIHPEREALLVLADLRRLWVLADVPEARMREVQVGARAVVQPIGSAPAIEGQVSYIAPFVDPTTRTSQARIVIEGPDSGLRAGMFASVDILVQAAAAGPVLAVPEGAVQRIDGQPCVFVPVPGTPGAFAKRLVLVGPAVGGMVPVRSGLDADAEVVVSNSFLLKAELGKAGAQHQH